MVVWMPADDVYASRKSDIENERLPPDLYDADSEEGRAILATGSLPATPKEPDHVAEPSAPVTPNGVTEGINAAIFSGSIPSGNVLPSTINTTNIPPGSPAAASPTSPITPSSPSMSPPVVPFRRGHSRQASLGTTMTSPSTRRRSLESTMSLIQGVLDGKDDKTRQQGRIDEKDETPRRNDAAVEGLAEQLAESSVDQGRK